METKIRAFIAIEFDTHIKDAIRSFITKEFSEFSNIHFTEKENLHATLQFLGNINETILESLYDTCTDIASVYQPFELELQTIGVFPNERNPRILWVGLHDEKETLKNIAKNLKEALQKFPIKHEDKEFTPHLSIGRIKVQKNTHTFIDRVKSLENTTFGKQTVNSFSLIQSTLTNTGPIYNELKRFDFGRS